MHKRKTVLYVSYWSDLYSGAQLAMYDLITDMRKRHDDIDIAVLTSDEGDLAEQCRKDNIPVFIVRHYPWITWNGNPSTYFLIKQWIKIFLNHIYTYPKFFRKLKREGWHFDLIHTNTNVTDIGDALDRHLHLREHVIHLREHGILDYSVYFALPDRLVRREFDHAAASIAISKSICNHYVHERKLAKAQATRLIYDGLPIPKPYKKSYAMDNRINFCMTGAVISGKNHIMAVRSCIKLLCLTDNFMLHIVGGGSPEYIKLVEDTIRTNHLEAHVKFWGFRRDINEVLRQMDVGMTLSKAEGFGRVTIEYMLNYMPVLGVNTGATPELIQEGINGYICALDDTDRLADLMYDFIKNPSLIESMGSHARKRGEEFSLERNTDEVYRLYCELWEKKELNK